MLSTIGDTLTIAAGIAISPLAIVAAILALMSPNATRNALAFLTGWLLGLIVVLSAFTFLGTLLQESDPDAAKPITGAVKILLGLGLLALGWKQWQSRPAPGEAADLPSWLQAIDGYGPARMIGLGLLLTTAGAPKNVMLAIAAAKTISSAELPWEQAIVVAVVFLVVASASVGGPVIAYLIAPDRVRAPLAVLRTWFAQNAATVMTVVLAILGVNLIGKGLGNF
ncbi:MAG TPA: GAP family protein [Thermomicrobiales bacterium]|nr:GAP family protein [Thermomicrobiales bacterium]